MIKEKRMKSIRKGAKVRLNTPNKDFGEFYEVYKKEKNFVYLISLSRPQFGVCITCGIGNISIVE